MNTWGIYLAESIQEYLKLFKDLDTAIIEIIGIISSVLILTSMLAKTRTYKGTMFMRILNTFGSIGFIAYALMLDPPAYATLLINVLIIPINLTHLIKEYKSHKKTRVNI